MAFVSLTLDAHDNGSSTWLKFRIPITQEHTNQKVPQYKIKEWTRVSLELGVLSMSSSRLSILKA